MTKENIIDKIIGYFRENEDIFNNCIEELDIYNGYLGDDRYYEMECLNEHYFDTEPMELLYRVFYGHDEDSYNTDSIGNRTYSEFNPNREYFYYNGYGNLISTDYKDYTDKLDNYVIEAMLENRQYIDEIENDEELTELFDELENCEGEQRQ